MDDSPTRRYKKSDCEIGNQCNLPRLVKLAPNAHKGLSNWVSGFHDFLVDLDWDQRALSISTRSFLYPIDFIPLGFKKKFKVVRCSEVVIDFPFVWPIDYPPDGLNSQPG